MGGKGGRAARLGSDSRRNRLRWSKTTEWRWKEGAVKLRNALVGKSIEEDSRCENKQASKRVDFWRMVSNILGIWTYGIFTCESNEGQ